MISCLIRSVATVHSNGLSLSMTHFFPKETNFFPKLTHFFMHIKKANKIKVFRSYPHFPHSYAHFFLEKDVEFHTSYPLNIIRRHSSSYFTFSQHFSSFYRLQIIMTKKLSTLSTFSTYFSTTFITKK